MFKRLFWIGVGAAAGVILVSKAEAYVRANTPKRAREFIMGEDQDRVPQRTLAGLVAEFTTAMRYREEELNRRYTDRFHG